MRKYAIIQPNPMNRDFGMYRMFVYNSKNDNDVINKKVTGYNISYELIHIFEDDDITSLEDIFLRFQDFDNSNINPEDKYYGFSISVADIIADITDIENIQYHLVMPCGFIELTNFNSAILTAFIKKEYTIYKQVKDIELIKHKAFARWSELKLYRNNVERLNS